MRSPSEVARQAVRAPHVEPTCPTALHPVTLDAVLPCPECDVIHAARVIAAHIEEVAADAQHRRDARQARIAKERDDYRATARALRGLTPEPASPACVAALHDQYADTLTALLHDETSTPDEDASIPVHEPGAGP